jgi:hypothetical protein
MPALLSCPQFIRLGKMGYTMILKNLHSTAACLANGLEQTGELPSEHLVATEPDMAPAQLPHIAIFPVDGNLCICPVV